MGWADWMVINQSLEEELEVERSVREVHACTDEEALKELSGRYDTSTNKELFLRDLPQQAVNQLIQDQRQS